MKKDNTTKYTIGKITTILPNVTDGSLPSNLSSGVMIKWETESVSFATEAEAQAECNKINKKDL